MDKSIADLVQLARTQLQLQEQLNGQLLGELTAFEELLDGLRKTVVPLCEHSEFTRMYGSNLATMQQLAAKLSQVEQENQQILDQLASDFRVGQPEHMACVQRLLSNRYYLLAKHPQQSVSAIDRALRRGEDQVYGLIQKGAFSLDFQAISDASTPLLMQPEPRQSSLSQVELLQSSLPALQEAVHLGAFESVQLQPTWGPASFPGRFPPQAGVFFRSPDRFSRLLKGFVHCRRHSLLHQLQRYSLHQGVLVQIPLPAQPLQVASFADTYTMAYLELVKQFPGTQKVLEKQDPEFERFYTQDGNSQQEQQKTVYEFLKDRAAMQRKAFRKLYNSKQAKALYAPPTMGYQAGQHPLCALFIQLFKAALELRNSLASFFAECLQVGQNVTGDAANQPTLTSLGPEMRRACTALVDALTVACIGPGFENACQLVVDFAQHAKKTPSHLQPVLDLLQALNVLCPLYFRAGFCLGEDWALRPDFVVARLQHPKTVSFSQFYADGETLSWLDWALSPARQEPLSNLRPGYLLKGAFQRALGGLVEAGQVLLSRMDFFLFPPFRVQNNTLVHAQAALVLNQLAQLTQYNRARDLVLHAKAMVGGELSEGEDQEELQQFDFTVKKFLNYKLDPLYEETERRIRYLVYYCTQMPQQGNSTQQLLQRLNTLGYVYDYLTDPRNSLSQLVSNNFKEYLQNLYHQTVHVYRAAVWDPISKRLKPDLLMSALRHVYQKWSLTGQFGVTPEICQQLNSQLTSFQNRKQDIISSQDRESTASEDSAISGLDMDQVTESGFSVAESGPIKQNYIAAGGQKIKSKRVKAVIQDCIGKFTALLKPTLEAHKDFYCVSKIVSAYCKNAVVQSVYKELELFEAICHSAAVSQRYYEENCIINAQGLLAKINQIFGE